MNINTFGTNTVPEAIERAVNRTFSLLAEIIDQLDLLAYLRQDHQLRTLSKIDARYHLGKSKPPPLKKAAK
jgi:hypothetical protein